MMRQRIPRHDDGAIYRLIVNELVPHSQIMISPEDLEPKAISRRLDRNMTYVLAKSGRGPYGFISFQASKGQLFIDMIALDSSFQRRGQGSLLMEAAERFGRRRRCRKATLFVDENNRAAQLFYDRKGYQVADYVPSLHCFRLVKTL
jgi:ribosomal protein S18 acetylase RimI-like enzyme